MVFVSFCLCNCYLGKNVNKMIILIPTHTDLGYSGLPSDPDVDFGCSGHRVCGFSTV